MTLRTGLILTLLLAVSATAYSSAATKSSSHEVRHGVSKIRINQAITIPLSKTRVFFQDGKIGNTFNDYRPHCNIEVRLRDDENNQLIEPSEYQITKTQKAFEEVVNFKLNKEIKLAYLDTLANDDLVAFMDDGSTNVYRGYHFYLSGEDANVYRLTCRGVYAGPHEVEFPTRDEIRKSLGDIITVQ